MPRARSRFWIGDARLELRDATDAPADPMGSISDAFGNPNYDIAPDGQRFLMIQGERAGAETTSLEVVLNWHRELERLVAAGR